jgi:hypothetical protein
MSVGQGGEGSVEDRPGIPNHMVQYHCKAGEAQTVGRQTRRRSRFVLIGSRDEAREGAPPYRPGPSG